MILTNTRRQLIDMYIKSLKENKLPWRQGWISKTNINGITNKEYRGVNQLLLSMVATRRNYDDPRWLTYLQIKQKGYKLKGAKNKGVPIEFWIVYDMINKRTIDFASYEKITEKYREDKSNYKIVCKVSHVYNATHIDGIPELIRNKETNNIKVNKYVSDLIKNLGVKYSEYGNKAFYRPLQDEVVLPKREKFIDEYSYYATQLHELCHATGNKKRLNRKLYDSKEDYAREELVAEISSSFLMQKLQVDRKAEHFDNHKAYIQSWIQILENNPQELFKAINQSNKVCEYIRKIDKIKKRECER